MKQHYAKPCCIYIGPQRDVNAFSRSNSGYIIKFLNNYLCSTWGRRLLKSKMKTGWLLNQSAATFDFYVLNVSRELHVQKGELCVYIHSKMNTELEWRVNRLTHWRTSKLFYRSKMAQSSVIVTASGSNHRWTSSWESKDSIMTLSDIFTSENMQMKYILVPTL